MRNIIHKEGKVIILNSFIILAIINIFMFKLIGIIFITISFLTLSIFLWLIIFRFFRIPVISHHHENDTIYSPADGKVVVVEEVFEEEYFKKKMIQISVFMSIWNVHINWYPISGQIKKYVYHPGKYLVARHPKSSQLNERNTTVIKSANGQEILVRQIAGFVARRVVSYATVGENINPDQEMGFIKFGSRLDVFLPLGTPLLIKPGDKVKGNRSKIALLKKS